MQSSRSQTSDLASSTGVLCRAEPEFPLGSHPLATCAAPWRLHAVIGRDRNVLPAQLRRAGGPALPPVLAAEQVWPAKQTSEPPAGPGKKRDPSSRVGHLGSGLSLQARRAAV